MTLKSQEGLLHACLQSWTLTLTLASYPTISSKSSSPRKHNVFARTRKPICCLFFFAWCILRLTKDLNKKSAQLFCSPYIFVIGPHKKGIFRNVSKQLRRRSLSKLWGGGGGLIKGSFIDRTAVHGCHCPNLTTAWLAQLGELRSAERVVC